jgi:hypothetical protein
VEVKDFGALTDDGKDDTEGILAAINQAREQGIKTVKFESGTYEFIHLPGWDAGQAIAPHNYMELADIHDLELMGETDEKGDPATIWLKHNDLKERQPGIMDIKGGTNISMHNIIIDMAPYYYSAGKVIGKEGEITTIEVFEGHPYGDGQPAFNMGTYDLEAGKAKVVRITWDFDLPRWEVVGKSEDRKMRTSHKRLSEYTELGDGVFWFQGNYTAALIRFSMIENLLVENVHIWNGHGFPLQCRFNTNVTYRKVKLYPPGNRIATACRDGFKIFCTGGEVVMDQIHIEGCLGDDGQNIHGLWLTPKEIRGAKEMVVHYPIGNRPLKQLTPGKKIRLLDQNFQSGWESTIVTSQLLEGSQQLVTFADDLPAWVNDSTPVEATEWLPETMLVKNSVFRNTGRFGILLKSSNTLIDSCVFEYNTAAIRMGGEWHPLWLESMHSQNVEIRNCTFRDNNLNMLYGGSKMSNAINIGSNSMPRPGLMKNIRIHDNTFIDEGTCMVLKHCENVRIWNNTFINCGEELEIEAETTADIQQNKPGS